MARGYPDYFGQSIFPKYGPMVAQFRLTNIIAPGGEADIFSVNFKGRTYGGWFRLHNINNATDKINFSIYVDGVHGNTFNLLFFYEHNYTQMLKGYINVTRYDFESHYFGFIMPENMSFDSSYALRVYNNDAANVSVTGEALFSQVK